MGYTKQVFEDGKVLYAEELNQMSQGIVDAEKVKVIELANFNSPTQDELKALYDAAINHENFMICAEVGVSHPVYFTPVNIVTMNLSDDPEQDYIVVIMTVICNYGIAFEDSPQLNVPELTSNTSGIAIARDGTTYTATMNTKIGSSSTYEILPLTLGAPTQEELKAIYNAVSNNTPFLIRQEVMQGLGHYLTFNPSYVEVIEGAALMSLQGFLDGMLCSYIYAITYDGTTYVLETGEFSMANVSAIGDTEVLATQNKSTLVDAINEVNGKADVFEIINIADMSTPTQDELAATYQAIISGKNIVIKDHLGAGMENLYIAYIPNSITCTGEDGVSFILSLGNGISSSSMITLNNGVYTIETTNENIYDLVSAKQDKITVTENDDGTVDITIPTGEEDG